MPISSACLLDAKTGIDEEAEAILAKAASVNHDKILVINKVDLVQREKLLAMAQAANERMKFVRDLHDLGDLG